MKDVVINKGYIEDYMDLHNITSYTQPAQDIGISTATLTRVLNGERKPGYIIITKMLSYFGEPFEVLFFWDS